MSLIRRVNKTETLAGTLRTLATKFFVFSHRCPHTSSFIKIMSYVLYLRQRKESASDRLAVWYLSIVGTVDRRRWCHLCSRDRASVLCNLGLLLPNGSRYRDESLSIPRWWSSWKIFLMKTSLTFVGISQQFSFPLDSVFTIFDSKKRFNHIIRVA